MKKRYRELLPSGAATLGMLALPLVLTLYFVITRYSQEFIASTQVNYFDVQESLLTQWFISQAWLEWFNRFMDFAFWGVIALIVIMCAWAYSSTKVALSNHYTQQEFANFKTTKTAWHEKFFIVLIIKVILIVLVLYSIFAIIGKSIPQLAASISAVVYDFNVAGLKSPIVAFLAIFIYQYLIASSIKIFKHLSSE